MGNILAWPIIRLVQRVSIIVTLGCCVYVILFLISRNHDNAMPINSKGPLKDAVLISPTPALELKPGIEADSGPARDIFSLSDVNSSGIIENTPKGQLPAHLKIVGIVVADPSQIIIEDTFAKKTYFIDEYHPQDGIKIVHIIANQMTINYQGQDINVPITKN